jgi:DNA-binding beta-propeller fold protein YncE
MRRLLALSLVLLGGCGGDDPRTPVAGDPGVAHIHGVGVNPADDAVIVATHTGLFRAARGEQRARRIGDRRQDTMGFTVVGPDRFLGSGHPDARDDLPPLLGLIRSDDAGRSWQPVSLLGAADFHVLRAAGRKVYGVNSADGALLASADGGRTWEERRPPGPVLDLAIDPADDERIVVAGEDGLAVSRDGGRGWRPLGGRAGLLAWTDALVLVDAAGDVHTSTDAGRTFAQVGSLGGQPAALAAHDGALLAALHDNTVRVSDDGGRTWDVRVRAG